MKRQCFSYKLNKRLSQISNLSMTTILLITPPVTLPEKSNFLKLNHSERKPQNPKHFAFFVITLS